MKKFRSNQAFLLINSFAEFSKTQFFTVCIVKTAGLYYYSDVKRNIQGHSTCDFFKELHSIILLAS